MDISSLNIGPENFKGVPARSAPPPGWTLPAEKPVAKAAAR
jgi:hypothetical protein